MTSLNERLATLEGEKVEMTSRITSTSSRLDLVNQEKTTLQAEASQLRM